MRRDCAGGQGRRRGALPARVQAQGHETRKLTAAVSRRDAKNTESSQLQPRPGRGGPARDRTRSALDLQLGEGLLELLRPVLADFRPGDEEFLEVHEPLEVLQSGVTDLGTDEVGLLQARQSFQVLQAGVGDRGCC
jgi:hypothetical protein